MNTANDIAILESLLSQNKFPVVDITPTRGKIFEKFVIVEMCGDGDIPTSIRGWQIEDYSNKMEIPISAIGNIKLSDYTLSILPPNTTTEGIYKVFNILEADLD